MSSDRERWYVVQTRDAGWEEEGWPVPFEVMNLHPRFDAYDLLADGCAVYADGPWPSRESAQDEVDHLNVVLEVLTS